MIIRLTVHNNSYNSAMSLYFKRFYRRLSENSYEGEENCLKKQSELDKISNLINPNNNIILTDEYKDIIIKRVVETFNDFIERTERDSAEYLKKSLEVAIVDCMYDKNENKEVWYWFQHSDTFICQ